MGDGRDGTRNLRMERSVVSFREHWHVPGQTSSGDPVDSHRLCITVPATHWMVCSIEVTPSLTNGSTQKSAQKSACCLPRQHELGGRGVGELVQKSQVWES